MFESFGHFAVTIVAAAATAAAGGIMD